jgi:hypothetical protein
MRRAARWGTLSAILVLTACVSAHAADDRASREAEARFTEGLAAVKNKDYEAARLSFAQAYTVLHRPLILWNLALSEEKSNHPLEAIGHFRQVTRDLPGGSEWSSAQKHLDALLTQMGRIDVQAPAGSSFILDGAEVAGTAPLADPLDVKPGHHVVEAKMTQGGTKAASVDVTPGQIAHVTLAADAPAPAPVAAPAPIAPAGRNPATTEAQGTDATPVTEGGQSSRTSTAKVVLTVTFVGAAAAAAGLGAYFGLQSRDNANTAAGDRQTYGQSACGGSAPPSYCGTWDKAVQTENRDAMVSNILYIGAGVFAVSAVVTWFLWPKGGRSASAWVLPTVGPAGAGVGAGGRF